MQLKILSWNIWCDCEFPKVCDFLRKADADVIGIQEIVKGDTSRDVAAFLSRLGYSAVVASAGPVLKDGRMLLCAVFTKYPIQRSEIHALSQEDTRYGVEADIGVENTVLTVFSVHLKHTHKQESPIHSEQVESLLRRLPAERVVVMGDFNAVPEMQSIKRISEVLVDTDPHSLPTWSLTEGGCDVCKPQGLDTRIDYIFTSKDLKVNSFTREKAEGSDHLPISVTIDLI